MAKEVEDINKGRNKSTLERHKKGAGEDSVPVDVESSKSLILSWAKELDRLNMSRGLTKKASVKAEVTEMKDKDVCDISKDSERIMKWAQELQTVTEPDQVQIQSLGECFQLLTDMAKELEDINKGRNKSTLERQKKGAGEDSVPVDVESSKSLILSWAKELDRLNMSRGVTKKASVKAEVTEMKDKDVCDISKDSERIMKWAQELQTVTENLCLTDGDLKHILTNHREKHRKLDEVLPFLEFVVWSLLSHDTEEDVSKMWLPAKQRTWKTSSQKYIPNSVDVLLDSSSCHPWLYVSKDKLKVYELHNPPQQQQRENPQIFDKQPFVLGLNGFSTGRHYWEGGGNEIRRLSNL
ncbi:hypothetical protein KOW79_006389 [Hemibagrus wyckioides]|uniref:B30.2/SPRY domain-containing protein n=1 Tax=Hemibagrus wyckioides TaxID=337641 RepID=A0A9D3P083_9TELE|nr:hypothetical protein KOW79_006389 [Hemibagrus wyckioides]